MGKHFSATELDRMHKLHAQGVAVADILSRLSRTRTRLGQGGPDLTSVRRALKGRTFKRGRAETRGRPRRLTRHNLRPLDKARMRLVKKMDGDGEVHWDDAIRAARVPLVDRTTASKALRAAGYDICWRNPRAKPPRSGMDEADRAKRLTSCGSSQMHSGWRRSMHTSIASAGACPGICAGILT